MTTETTRAPDDLRDLPAAARGLAARLARAAGAEVRVVHAPPPAGVSAERLGAMLRRSSAPVLVVGDVPPADGPPATIVCAHDFSATAAEALDRATRLARPFGARVEVVHALQDPPRWLRAIGASPTRSLAVRQREAAWAKLERARGQVHAAGLDGGCHLLEGEPAEVLARCAREVGGDLLVMGAAGNSAGGDPGGDCGLGSVAAATTRRSACPVLIVPGPRGPGPAPVGSASEPSEH